MTIRNTLMALFALILVISGQGVCAEEASELKAVLVAGASSGTSPTDAGYTTSKFAVEGYTDSLAMELADTGVHVAIVEPGAYKSRIRDKYVAKALATNGDSGIVDETRQRLLQLNDGQPCTYSRDELIALLDDLLEADK